jgi:hypothetical protein
MSGDIQGVTFPMGFDVDPSRLKRDLLLVDRIVVMDDGWSPYSKEVFTSLEFLRNRGVVSDFEGISDDEDSSVAESESRRLMEQSQALGGVTGSMQSEIACRIARVILQHRSGIPTVSLHPPSGLFMDSPGKKTVESMNIVIGSLPVPNDSTSLEAILYFRDDPDTKRKRQLLQRWTHNLATKGVTSEREIVQEIEWAVSDYEDHMRLHKLKINRGALETVIVTSVELAEDLVKFKWGKLAKGLFGASHRRIELLEAEAKAPGRELAFISKARERFD